MIELSDIEETILITHTNEALPYSDELKRRLITRLQKWRFVEAVTSGVSQENIASNRTLDCIAAILPRETKLIYLVPNVGKFFVAAYGERIVETVASFLRELRVKRIKYGKHAIPRVERNLSFLAYFGFNTD